MNKYQSYLKSISKNLILSAAIIVLQLQFGCQYKNFPSSNRGSTGDTGVVADKNENQKMDAAVPELCRNSYYPVGQNVERKYRTVFSNNSLPPSEYTDKFADFTNDAFVVKADFGTVSTNTNWRCTADGLLATQYINSVNIKESSTSDIETVETKGVTFPPDSQWNIGGKWTAEYKIKQTMKNPNGQKTAESNGTIRQDYEIGGTEEISVPAGTFQASKVNIKSQFELTVKVGKMTVPTKVLIESTAWFSKNVGLVKTETKPDATGTGTTELESYTGIQ